MTHPADYTMPVHLDSLSDNAAALMAAAHRARRPGELITATFRSFTTSAGDNQGAQPILPRSANRLGALIIPQKPAASPNSPAATGAQTNPAAGTVICSASLPPGLYTVNWLVVLTGTSTATDDDNFGLYLNGVLIATSLNSTASQPQPQSPLLIDVPEGANQALAIQAVANSSTGGVIYRAQLTAVAYNVPGQARGWLASSKANAASQEGAPITAEGQGPVKLRTQAPVWLQADPASTAALTIAVIAWYEGEPSYTP